MPEVNAQTGAPQVEEQVVEQTVETNLEQTKSFKDVIKELLAGGARRFNGLRIKNVKYSEEDNYTRVTLVVHPPIPGMVSDDDGVTWHPGKTNNIFTSNYALAGMLKEDEDKAWLAEALVDNPAAFNIIMNGGLVDIVQQTIPAGTPYKNPFSTREDAVETTFDHDVIINYVVNIVLGKAGQRYADILAVKMMGF